MNNLSWPLRGLAALALAAGAWLGTAQAAPVVTIDPVTQDLAVGGTTFVNIVVSNLNQPTEAIGGFSLLLSFNTAYVSGVSFVNDPGGTMGLDPLDFSEDFAGGTLELFFIADSIEDESSLALAQGSSFTLATIEFFGVAPGLSPLTLSNVNLSYADGETTIPGVTTRNGAICVGGDCTNVVPEPASYALVLAALGAAGLARRRAKKAA